MTINDYHASSGQPSMTGVQILDSARSAVRRIRHTRTQPTWVHHADDDVVGDVVETCIRAQNRGATITAGYVYTVARNMMSRDRSLCSADARALRLLHNAIHDLEQRQGHNVTSSQVDEIADQIIRDWDHPSRFPTRGFHRRVTEISLDAPTASGATLADMLATTLAHGPPEEESGGSTGEVERLLDRAMDATGKAEHSSIKRAAWDALASITGAPRVKRPVVKNRVTWARTTVKRHSKGPEVALAIASNDILEGRENELTRAVLTPFGDLNRLERQKMLDQLWAHPSHALDLWSAALSSSSSAFSQ